MSGSVLIHASLSAWASDEQVAEAWKTWLGPLIEGLCRGGPVALVLQGRLLEQCHDLAPSSLEALRRAVSGGTIEPVATAMYGPVLSAIPERDAIQAVKGHTTLVKQILGVRPTGMWTPQGAWDPTLPRVVSKAGLNWTTLDRDWLDQAGAPNGPRLSVEREGRMLVVLPHGPREELRVFQVRGRPDLAEALGAAASSRVLPSVLVGEGPLARAYLGAGSPDGLWERRLLQDAGADALHKRMLAVSRSVRRLKAATEQGKHSDEGPDPREFLQARRYLHRAQAAEAYAPVRGATEVDQSSRHMAWRDLIRAELVVSSALGLAESSTERFDLDCDGSPEVRLRSAAWSVTVAPDREGVLTEIAWLKGAFNILGGALPIGFRERWGGVRPVAMRWELVTQTTQGSAARAVLVADGHIDGVPVRVTKRVDVPASAALTVTLEVQNRGEAAAHAPLVSEIFLSLGGSKPGEDCALSVEVAGGKVPLDEVIELPALDAVGVVGWAGRVEILTTPPARVLLDPLDQGGVRVALSWPVELWPRDREQREIRLIVREEHHA